MNYDKNIYVIDRIKEEQKEICVSGFCVGINIESGIFTGQDNKSLSSYQ